MPVSMLEWLQNSLWIYHCVFFYLLSAIKPITRLSITLNLVKLMHNDWDHFHGLSNFRPLFQNWVTETAWVNFLGYNGADGRYQILNSSVPYIQKSASHGVLNDSGMNKWPSWRKSQLQNCSKLNMTKGELSKILNVDATIDCVLYYRLAARYNKVEYRISHFPKTLHQSPIFHNCDSLWLDIIATHLRNVVKNNELPMISASMNRWKPSSWVPLKQSKRGSQTSKTYFGYLKKKVDLR